MLDKCLVYGFVGFSLSINNIIFIHVNYYVITKFGLYYGTTIVIMLTANKYFHNI